MVYWDAYRLWTQLLKSKLGVKASLENEALHQTSFSTPSSWLYIQYIHQSNIHLRIYSWKLLNKFGIILLYIREYHGQMLLNMMANQRFFPFTRKHLLFCCNPLMSHFHITVLTRDKWWKWESDTVPVDQFLLLLKCCAWLCTFRARMIHALEAISAAQKSWQR